MTPRNIRQTDLNLLIALNVLMEERNVTRAADRLDLTQSAASRMLGRLRATFDDPLFVRTSRGLTPTKRALDLAGPLQEYLAGLEKLLLERGDFDAATARRRFRIAAIDYVQAVLLAPLVAKLQHQAPQIDFEIRQPSTESERDLDAGVLDFLLMPQQRSGPGVVWTPLYHDTYTCLVWNRHSVERLTLTRFAAMEHVLVAPREVAVQASTFLIVPYLLTGTTRSATVPERIAAELVRKHPLRILKPPVKIPGFTMCQGWHEIHRNDPGHRWLRDALINAAKARPRVGSCQRGLRVGPR